jgi:hypothetical protein
MATRKRLSVSTDADAKTRAKKRSQARQRKYWNSVHKRNKGSKCIMQTTKKYLSRPSPPYPANKCCGKKMTGNDGSKYVAEPNAAGMCAWKKV